MPSPAPPSSLLLRCGRLLNHAPGFLNERVGGYPTRPVRAQIAAFKFGKFRVDDLLPRGQRRARLARLSQFLLGHRKNRAGPGHTLKILSVRGEGFARPVGGLGPAALAELGQTLSQQLFWSLKGVGIGGGAARRQSPARDAGPLVGSRRARSRAQSRP